MQEIKTNRKLKILLENNVQVLYVVIYKFDFEDYYMVMEIDDIKTDVSGKSLQETMEKAEDLKSKTNKNMVPMPSEWLEEKWWVGDDDDLNLSIFNLIDYKANEAFIKLINDKNKEYEK